MTNPKDQHLESTGTAGGNVRPGETFDSTQDTASSVGGHTGGNLGRVADGQIGDGAGDAETTSQGGTDDQQP